METFWLCHSEVRFYFWTCLCLVFKMQKTPRICKWSLFLSKLNIYSSFLSGNSEASSFYVGRACFLSWQAENSGPGSRSICQRWPLVLLAGRTALYSQRCRHFGGYVSFWVSASAKSLCGSRICCLLAWEQDSSSPAPRAESQFGGGAVTTAIGVEKMLYMPRSSLSAFLTAAQRKSLNFCFLAVLFLIGGKEK